MKAIRWRRMLHPVTPIYAAAIELKDHLLERGWLKQRRLRHPVISVGSLSTGGAGKTPFVMMLAEFLAAREFEVRILTRGYGRLGTGVERVDPNGDAARFGDEPIMMARRLAGLKTSAAVWVGADRFRAGRMSEQHDVPGCKVVYLLDDGFQHRKLSRDLDVVLLTRQELSDELLPVGDLRESLRAMRRADVVVLREDEGFAGEISGKVETWFLRRELRFTKDAAFPRRALAFCGLARPEGFFAMLEKAGVEVVAVSVFRDHYAYSSADVEALTELARLHGADGFVTTEKDAVKLSDAMRKRLQRVGALLVPELVVTLRDEAASLEGIIRIVDAKPASSGGP